MRSEIFTEEILECMAEDIAFIIADFYKVPENLKAYEEWKSKKDRACQASVSLRSHH